MKIVRRFPIAPVTRIDLPVEHRIVLVGYQPARSEFCMWVELDPQAPKTKTRTFELVGTGHPIADEAIHIGSAIMDDGFHVFHIYETP